MPTHARTRTTAGRVKSRALALAAATAATVTALALIASGAGAQAGAGCSGGAGGGSPCVLLIQVDGLEAADVTPEKTPFMWGLANPGQGVSGNLGQRNGWSWQAPRASMTASLGANTASMLTGGYPEQTGIVGDEVFKVSPEGQPGQTPKFNPSNAVHHRLESDADDRQDGSDQLDPLAFADGVQSILELNDLNGGTNGAFIGDPDLAPIAGMDPNLPDDFSDVQWTPTPRSPDNPGDPQGSNYPYCDVPRSIDPAENPPIGDPDPQSFRACAAKDEATLDAAFQALSSSDAINDVNLAYIQLAELGHIKRTLPSPDQVDQADEQVRAALAQLDANLALFFNRYANQNPALTPKFGNTIVFLVGSGGYEDTPIANRVPHPTEAGEDVEDWVENEFDGGGRFNFAPHGTVASVYYNNYAAGETAETPTQAHLDRLQTLKQTIEGLDGVAEVLYTRPQLAPPGQEDQVVENKYSSWHLDHTFFDINRETFEETRVRTGSSGDLVVVADPGWAFGKSTPTQSEVGGAFGESDPNAITNPYQASYGGPRNRSMAAIVNGPACTSSKCVINHATADRRAHGGRYPVSSEAEGSADAPSCSGTAPVATADVSAANQDPVDDANATGHECQAEMVDIGPTIAAVLSLSVPFQQIGGRLLHEAIRDLPEITERPEMPAPEAVLTAGPLAAAEGQAYPADYEGVPVFGFVGIPDKPQAPTFECQLVSGEVAPEALAESGWSACGDSPETRPDLCQSTVDEDDDAVPDVDANGNEIIAPFPCSSYAVSEPLAPGVYTFSVRASNDAGTLGANRRSTATFEVIDLKADRYNCDGVICMPARTFVSDKKGRSVDQAKKGKLLDHVTFQAGFGERFTAVDLTFYRADRGKKGKRLGKGKGGGKKKELTALANFEPFVLKLEEGDALAKLTFQVPRNYKPTHLGIDLEMLAKKDLTKKKAKRCQKSKNSLCAYKSVAKCKKKNTPTCFAEIFKIEDAGKLHTKAKGKGKGNGKGGGGKGKGDGGKGNGGGKKPKAAEGKTAKRSIVLSPSGP